MKCLFKQEPMDGILWTGENHREMCEFLTGEKVDGILPTWHRNFEIDHSKVRGGLTVKVGGNKIPIEIGWFIVYSPLLGYLPCDPEVFKKFFVRWGDEPYKEYKEVYEEAITAMRNYSEK